jgi:heme exporter protein CcmD
MNHLAFVAAAYAIAIGATAVLIGWSWRSMRRAEQALETLRKRND